MPGQVVDGFAGGTAGPRYRLLPFAFGKVATRRASKRCALAECRSVLQHRDIPESTRKLLSKQLCSFASSKISVLREPMLKRSRKTTFVARSRICWFGHRSPPSVQQKIRRVQVVTPQLQRRVGELSSSRGRANSRSCWAVIWWARSARAIRRGRWHHCTASLRILTTANSGGETMCHRPQGAVFCRKGWNCFLKRRTASTAQPAPFRPPPRPGLPHVWRVASAGRRPVSLPQDSYATFSARRVDPTGRRAPPPCRMRQSRNVRVSGRTR